MQKDQAWVYNRHYLLHCNDFCVAQCLRAQLVVKSAALILGSVLVLALFRFGGYWIRFVHSVRFALVDLV